MTDTASQIWQKFVALPGATVDGGVGIASQYAIGGLIQLLHQRSPKRILEIGAGIGTLTYTILNWARSTEMERNPEFAFYTVENNEYCLGQLAVNLRDYAGTYRVVSSVEEARNSGLQFDLITVDGGGDISNDMGFMDFGGLLAERGVIFVEGARATQREKIKEWYGNRKFVNVKMESLQPIITSADGTLSAKNKPYHMFIFESGNFESLVRRAAAFGNHLSVRVARRFWRE